MGKLNRFLHAIHSDTNRVQYNIQEKRQRCLRWLEENYPAAYCEVLEMFKGDRQCNHAVDIDGFFTWRNTRQGHNYWRDLQDKYYWYLHKMGIAPMEQCEEDSYEDEEED